MLARGWLWMFVLGLGIASAQTPREVWRVLYNDGAINLAPNLRLHLADPDGGSYHAGTFETSTFLPLSDTVLRLDASGNLQWLQRFPFRPYRILLDPVGNLQAFTQGAILHYSPQGALVRAERMSHDSFSWYSSFTIDAGGNRYLWFGEGSVNGSQLVKRSPAGAVLWSRAFTGVTAQDVYVDTQGDVTIIGGVPTQIPTAYYLFMAKLNSAGNLLWQLQSSILSSLWMRILGETPAGELVVVSGGTGYYFSPSGAFLRSTQWRPPDGFTVVGNRDAVLHADGRIVFSHLLRQLYTNNQFFGLDLHAPTGALLWRLLDLVSLGGFLSRWADNNAPLAATPNSDATWFFAPDLRSGAPELKMFKLDAQGQTLWTRALPYNGSQPARHFGLLVNASGESQGVYRENETLRVVRYDTNGNLLTNATHLLTVPTHDRVSAALDGSGGVYALFLTDTTAYLRHYSSGGALLWEQSLVRGQLFVSTSGEPMLADTMDGRITVARYRADGTLRWQRTYNELPPSSSFHNLLATPDGGFYLLASHRGGSQSVLYILKANANGASEWLQAYPSSLQFERASVSPDGSLYLVLGNYEQNTTHLARYTPQGQLEWQIARSWRWIAALHTDSAGRLYLAETDSHSSPSTRRIAVYTPEGNLVWENIETGFVSDMAVSPQGQAYTREGAGSQRWIRAYNASGVRMWERAVDNYFLYGMQTDAAGRLCYFAREFVSSDALNPVIRVYRYTPSGAQEWTVDFEVADSLDIGAQLLVQPDGRGFTLYGRVWTPTGDWDAYLARYAIRPRGDADGNGCNDDADLLTVLFNFGQGGAGDVNEDGVVDDADLLEVLFGFGEGCE